MTQIKKAIIPVAGRGTRFLPLSQVLPKELWPLIDKPIIQYIVEEVQASGIKKIIFVTRASKKIILDYLKNQLKLDKISFFQVSQKQPLGDGHAVLQARKLVKREPCAVLFGDDVVKAKIPCLLQLIKIFERYQKPIIALYKLPKEKLSSYGIVRVEKVKKRLYEIKGIEEKPTRCNLPSDLAIVGKYIITPEVFHFLKKTPLVKGEIRLVGAFKEMIKAGKTIYGYEFDGKWLECGNIPAYIKSNFYLSKQLLERTWRNG